MKTRTHSKPRLSEKNDPLVLTFRTVGKRGIEEIINRLISFIYTSSVQAYEGTSEMSSRFNSKKLLLTCEYIVSILRENKDKIDIENILTQQLVEASNILEEIIDNM
jgi:hypothetical protein